MAIRHYNGLHLNRVEASPDEIEAIGKEHREEGILLPEAIFDVEPKLKPRDVHVYMAFLYHRHRNPADVTMSRIGRETGISTKTVQRAVKNLVKSGFLIHTIEQRPTGEVLAHYYEARYQPDGPGKEVIKVVDGRTRTTIPDRIAARVYRRDNFACQHCETTSELTIDHIIPVARGGSDEPDNLQVLCRTCNGTKGARAWEDNYA